MVDFVRDLSELTEISHRRILPWLGLSRSKYYQWRKRYGKSNEHNGLVPRDWWLEHDEKQAIIDYYIKHPDEGYRRLTYMMLDEDVVACAPSTVYRTLKQAGLLERYNRKVSKKGTGFVQPDGPHLHWHTDITYLNISGTFYYLSSVLDGHSRYIIDWDIKESMKEQDVEILLQKCLERFPDATPRIISDNGPQYIAKDFKEFIRLSGMTHVRTSPYYPQSNGKQERMQGTLKQECIREKCPQTLEQAKAIVTDYVKHYNECRLHSSIGYVTPKAMLEGRQQQIHTEREEKLAKARERRKLNRAKAQTLPLAS